MEFRPCIDIHNGKVKQIVGGSLKDAGNFARENFVSEQDAAFYAELYKKPQRIWRLAQQQFCSDCRKIYVLKIVQILSF